MQRLELCEQGVGGISLRGEGRKGGREDYGFLCRMRAFFLVSISFGERL